MKKFAVAYISFFENDIKVEVIDAKTWEEAVMKLSVWNGKGVDDKYLKESLAKGIDEAKGDAADGEWGFDIKEIV